MATTYYQPGVYIQEIDTPQVTIQSAPTAIPAFIGYTQIAQQTSPGDLIRVPTLITSMLDYVQFFGTGPGPSVTEVNLDANYNFINAEVNINYKMYDVINLFYLNGGGNAYIVSAGTFSPTAPSPQLSDFLGNNTLANQGCLAPLAKLQDPTLLVFPDNLLLGANWYEVYQAALSQCATVQSTFLIGDFYYNYNAFANGLNTWAYGASPHNYSNEVTAFREDLGINNLNYGAFYGPWIDVLPSQPISYEQIQQGNLYVGGALITNLASLAAPGTVQDTAEGVEELIADIATINTNTAGIISAISADLTSPPSFNSLSSLYAYLKALTTQGTGSASNSEIGYIFQFAYKIAATIQSYITGTSTEKLTNTGLASYLTNTTSPQGLIPTQFSNLFSQLVGYENTIVANDGWLGGTYQHQYTGMPTLGSYWTNSSTLFSSGNSSTNAITGYVAASTNAGYLANAAAVVAAVDSTIGTIIAQYNLILAQAQATEASQEVTLASIFPAFANIIKGVNTTPIALPPSGAIAGLYAYVDNNLGVWKAPANVSINGILGPDWTFASTEYDDLNVDINAGKSINAIRAFTGKGTLVWGARTLAGNDPNWRYVSVRRFFIMVEQAVKDALAAYVFEPNDANTWTTVIAEVNSYLFGLWRAGALMGTKPEQAYSVQCGLGSTMTQTDILNGNMIVTIGMAVVRPAEFIILQFTQNVQGQGN